MVAARWRGAPAIANLDELVEISDDPEDFLSAGDFEIDTGTASDSTVIAERTVGNGVNYVYTFFLPICRDVAIARGESRWPVKIGWTAALDTRLAAFMTGMPERPVVGLVIRHDDAKMLEQAIHQILILRGRRFSGTGGTEWFQTTPDEVLSLYEWIVDGEVSKGYGPIDNNVT